MNKVILIGRIGKDIELQNSGDTVYCRIRLATNDLVGTKRVTSWHTVVVFGKKAEAVAKHKGKGDQIAVTGRIDYSEFEDSKGVKRYSTSIIADQIDFI